MFFFARRREHAAFAPLLELARAKAPAEQRDWFADLRTEAPTVVARLEYLLAREQRLQSAR